MSFINKKNESKECNYEKKVINISKKKKKSGGCKSKRANVIEGEKSRYCYKHGCQYCYFKNPKITATSCGEECCGLCKPKLEERKTRRDGWQENENLKRTAIINEFKTKNEQLATNIKNIFPDFWEWGVKKAEENLAELIQKSIGKETELTPNGLYNRSCQHIDRSTSLKVEEKNKLKEIYYKLFVNHFSLDDFFDLKTNLLTLLAQKYKTAQEEREKERAIPKCHNCHFRRQQPTTFPDGFKGWCQECIKQKKQNEETPLPTPPPEENPNPLPTPPNTKFSQTKSKIQTDYNLDSEEFKSVLEPITDQKVLEAVQKLISKVKTGTAETDADSLLEFLLAYRDAPADSLKKQAYQAVNSYQQQVDQLIDSLESQKKKRKSSLKELVQAQNETELDQAYQLIKQDPELYQTENQSIIDNHQKRVASALQITAQNQVSALAQTLATNLRTVIVSDSEKDELISLEQKVKEFKTATSGEEQVLYQQYSSIIDQLAHEIQTELTRRENSEKEQQDTPTNPNTTTPPSPTNQGFLIFGFAFGGIIILLTLFYFYLKKKQWFKTLYLLTLTKNLK